MKPTRRTRKLAPETVGRIDDADGIDPRELLKKYRDSQRKPNRKALQLCRQVAETLSMVLSGDTRDEWLNSLQVVAVNPAPDTSRFLVLVSSDLETTPEVWQTLQDRLHHHEGRLRSEVAASICRKKTPQLIFQLTIPPLSEGKSSRE